jgi:hypothetical protein
MGDARIIDKNEASEPNILRPDLGRIVLASGLFLWAVILPLIYYITYQLLMWGEPGWVVAAIDAFVFLLANVVWRLMVYSGVHCGIVLGENGITYYERSTSRKKLFKRFFRWSDLHDPVIGVTKVMLRAKRFPMYLSYDQAREIFTDERCPSEARPSIEQARKLGV